MDKDSPRTLHLQPRPISTHISHFGGVTAIARLWAKGDPARCSLCASCCAGPGNLCLVQVPGHVSQEDAALFRFPPVPAQAPGSPSTAAG